MGIVRVELRARGDRAEESLGVLFDTGAARSLISGRVAEGIGSPRKLIIPREILVADGHKVRSEYLIDLAVEIGGRPIGIEAFIVEGLLEQLIFGALDMETYGIRLDLKKRQLDLSDFTAHMLAV